MFLIKFFLVLLVNIFFMLEIKISIKFCKKYLQYCYLVKKSEQ